MKFTLQQRVCDKCSAVVDGSPTQVHEWAAGWQTHRRSEQARRGAELSDVDLCPPCVLEYERWLRTDERESGEHDFDLRTLRAGDPVWCTEVDGAESPRVVDGDPRLMPNGRWAVPLDGDDGLVTLLRRLRRREA